MGRRAVLREAIRLEKTRGKPRGIDGYYMRKSELDAIRNEVERVKTHMISEMDKEIKKAQEKTIKVMILVFIMSLRNELDLSPLLINDVIERASLQFQCIQSGELSQNDLEIWCKENDIKF